MTRLKNDQIRKVKLHNSRRNTKYNDLGKFWGKNLKIRGFQGNYPRKIPKNETKEIMYITSVDREKEQKIKIKRMK